MNGVDSRNAKKKKTLQCKYICADMVIVFLIYTFNVNIVGVTLFFIYLAGEKIIDLPLLFHVYSSVY